MRLSKCLVMTKLHSEIIMEDTLEEEGKYLLVTLFQQTDVTSFCGMEVVNY